VSRSQHPFRDSVVKHAASRHRGLEITVFAPKHGPRFRAYLHTPNWERVVVVGTAESADAAVERVDTLLTRAAGSGVGVNLPKPSRPLRLQSPGEQDEDASATA
jgi:hypothetical protein